MSNTALARASGPACHSGQCSFVGRKRLAANLRSRQASLQIAHAAPVTVAESIAATTSKDALAHLKNISGSPNREFPLPAPLGALRAPSTALSPYI